MTSWLKNLAAQWRDDQRRRASSFGNELLSLPVANLRDLIESELELNYGRGVARFSRNLAGLAFILTTAFFLAFVLGAATLRSAIYPVNGTTTIVYPLIIFGPAMLAFAAAWAGLTYDLMQPTRSLNSILSLLPRIKDPVRIPALIPLLTYDPADAHNWRKWFINRQVEERLVSLLDKMEAVGADCWDARDWQNYRSLFCVPGSNSRLALAAMCGGERVGRGEVLSALRPLAESPHNVYSILGVRDLESERICDAARAAIRKIEAALANERQAQQLLRASHVKFTTVDGELVRPVPLHANTPFQQLLRSPENSKDDNEELLRVHEQDQRVES